MQLSEEFAKFRRMKNQLRRAEQALAKCRGSGAPLNVTAVGAGDALLNRYWPTLLDSVNQHRISLTLVDVGNLDALVQGKVTTVQQSGRPNAASAADALQQQYDRLRSAVHASGQNPVRYLDAGTLDGMLYAGTPPSADVVLILVPDQYHLIEARKWISHAALIFVEKPYAASLAQAEDFAEHYRMREEQSDNGLAFVVPIDHYLAKISPYLNAHGTVLPQIGELRTLEFTLTEHRPPEAHRFAALKSGLIADLYPHALAALSAFVDIRSAANQTVTAGKADGSPIQAETYAHIESDMLDRHGAPVRVCVTVGKGIGDHDEKYLRVIGTTGQLVLNFTTHPDFGSPMASRIPGSQSTIDADLMQRNRVSPLYESGHAEFLQSVLSGNYLEQLCGGLSVSEAHATLREIDLLRTLVPKQLKTYAAGTPVADIQRQVA